MWPQIHGMIKAFREVPKRVAAGSTRVRSVFESARSHKEALRRQWRYQPSLLNGDPIEVVTTIAVQFRLKG